MTLDPHAQHPERDSAGTHVTNSEGMNLRENAAAGDRAGETGPDRARWGELAEFEERRPGRKTRRRQGRPATPNKPGGSSVPAMAASEDTLYLTRREAAALA